MPKRDDKSYKSKGSSNPRDPKNRSGVNSVNQLYDTENKDKWVYDDETKLREAELLSFMSGMPLIGGFVRGIQGARYMDDYYRNTGFIPSYPGLNDPYGGFSTLGRTVGNTALSLATRGGSAGYNVKEGTNDLLTFYNYAYQ